MNHWEEFERRIRERGVRVEERLGLLGLLRGGDEEAQALLERREQLLAEVRRAAQRTREAL